jgi:hypothetical protein
MNQAKRELTVGVEWGVGLLVGLAILVSNGKWKYVSNRRTWHVLWRLASRRLWRMMGRGDTIYFSISGQRFIDWVVKEIFIGS